MNSNKNKALQYMKILKEYDQADSLYDNTVYADPNANEEPTTAAVSKLTNLDPGSSAMDPTKNQSSSNNIQSGQAATTQPAWYSAIVHDAWDAVQKSVETSDLDQVLSSAWDTVGALTTTSSSSNMKAQQSRQPQGNSTNLVFPQSKEARQQGTKPASSRSIKIPSAAPEVRQPTQINHAAMETGGGKRLDPESTAVINKERKEHEAKKRAARAKKKGAAKSKKTAGGSVSTGPKSKKINKEPPGARKDPPGAAKAGMNDDATVVGARGRKVASPSTRKQLVERHQQPRSIVRHDLEDTSSSILTKGKWDLSMLPIAECTGAVGLQRAVSPVPLRPCDIPRGSEIKKKNESILAGLEGDFFTKALKPFGF